MAGATENQTAEALQAQAENTVGPTNLPGACCLRAMGAAGSPPSPEEGGGDSTYNTVVRIQQFSTRERLEQMVFF